MNHTMVDLMRPPSRSPHDGFEVIPLTRVRPPCDVQMSNEDRYDGQYALDISRREFVCPLCKTLSNILVPHLPEHYSPPATPTPPSASTSGTPGLSETHNSTAVLKASVCRSP